MLRMCREIKTRYVSCYWSNLGKWVQGVYATDHKAVERLDELKKSKEFVAFHGTVQSVQFLANPSNYTVCRITFEFRAPDWLDLPPPRFTGKHFDVRMTPETVGIEGLGPKEEVGEIAGAHES
jgi:hypothetical protein